MRLLHFAFSAAVLGLPLLAQPSVTVSLKPGRDANQPVDEEYTKKIREYTTEPFFNSPLTDYLPASKTVPTPKAVLGDVSGAPGILPYSYEVYKYMRMLEAASPRVKVFTIGKTEEGREMIAVAVASERLIAQLDQNRDRLSQLADPRKIKFDEATADRLIAASTPIYYITGTIHSPETGAPTALMELAYRLAVDESAYIKNIRENVITLITPIVEVDGRDRMVDIYRWHLANPGKQWPNLVYWGHYVAHDNNRDAMGLTLQLTRNVLKTFVGWKAQVLHDLHESVPYLYDNTIGDGPYNAWIDPMLADEWQMMGWNNVSEMTKFGMPGVFTHGTFDTWSPSYLMFIAATHNGISRLYETFGNGGADTEERTLRPNEYARTWFKQNPPLPKTKWSQRNNNNYEQTGVLTALAYFSANNKLFLRNFYIKAKRSIEKPKTEGPSAYVFTADDPRLGAQADLLRMLQDQGCEISRATSSFTVTMPAKKPRAGRGGRGGGADATDGSNQSDPPKPAEKPKPEPRTFPAGSYVLRMDQPYSRIADTLLDHQYWATNDPQKAIYDDTGWTFGELGNVQVTRVTDVKVLDAGMTLVSGSVAAPGGVEGSGSVFLINNNTDSALITLRYRFPSASFDAAEEPFEAAGHKFNRGSFIVGNISSGDLAKSASELGLRIWAADAAPAVKKHPVRAARIGFMHTWLNTQAEGWWRVEFDRLKIPYTYFSTQTVSKDADLRSKYDVIIFAPGAGGNPQTIVEGRPMFGNPLPWKVTAQTPNLAKTDETDDMRPGLGWSGVEHLHKFVEQGGLLLTANDTANFAVTFGFAPGVSITPARNLKVTGSGVRSKIVDGASPILYGYSDNLAIFASNPPVFGVSNMVGGGGGGGGGRGGPASAERPTGRGTADDPDIPQGRAPVEIPDEPRGEAWEATPITSEQLRNPINVIPPAARPRVVLRYANAPDLLVTGLLDNGAELAQHAAVIDAPVGQGHVVLFSNNPFWRAETKGSYFLVFNAILNFDNLAAGRKLADK